MSVKQFLERTSVRDFDKKPMPQEDIKTITEVINNAPTSTNAQQFSAIIFTNQDDKEWFAKMNWGQQHIVDSAAFILFLADRTRAKYDFKKYASEDIATYEVYRGVVDATIGATYAQDALIAMGYGVTMVGGVVAFAEDIEERFNLPETTQVIVALSVGKATKTNDFKPKMNKVFINGYDKQETVKELLDYDDVMKRYYKDRGQSHDHIKYQSVKVGPEASEGTIKFLNAAGKYFQKQIDITKK